ncbi:MAG: glycosyl hydrolase family 8 [Bacteroidia bacterium]
MKTAILFIAFLFISVFKIVGQSPNYPFPHHTVYNGNHIKPTNYTPAELDNQTKSFYDEWKGAYLKNDCGNTSEYYVFSGNGAKNVSEAQGYGMMIAVYFAGYDNNAKIYFDGLYQFYKKHRSGINNKLMDWQQLTCTDKASADDDAASDGDIDIAFSLLLAHEQWGSGGAINYLAEAKIFINAIMKDEINQNTWTVKLGDWTNASDTKYFYGTRPSDFITDHFKSFTLLDNNWNNVTETCYSLIEKIQLDYSTTPGLIPDFIIDANTTPKPAGANYLEAVTDGSYSYNSCRVPLRITTDYLINGEIKAKAAVNKLNTWLFSAVKGDVSTISNGYELNGKALYNWNDATFIGPFAVGAMLDVTNQPWLNSLYKELVTNNDLAKGNYYSNTLKLLSMIVISGNYWVPVNHTLNVNGEKLSNENFKIYPNSTAGIFYIDFSHTVKEASFRLTDINGKVLQDNIPLQNHNTINISSHEAGIYLISIITNNTIITKKIVKE